LETSPCIDAGHPDPGYNDPDGSRCDIGALPFEAPAIVYICGDSNGDDAVNIGDAVTLINYVFKGGPPPDPECLGDANGDASVNVGDAVYLINFVFSGGPEPVEGCCP
jgi:hypothetical protein